MRKIRLKLKFLKIFLCLILLMRELSAIGPAIVSVTNYNDFRITDSENNSQIGTFQISVYRQPKKCSDGSIELELRITTDFQEKIKYDDKEIENSENGKIFLVKISDPENKIFFRTIELKSDNPNYKFEEIKLKIEPSVEISVDSRIVDFGRLWWNGHRVISENFPSVRIRYTILKNAVCEVKSENNFRLKHCDKNEFIPYFMNDMKENGDLFLNSNSEEYFANFKIDGTALKNMPYAGDYHDRITFTIKTNQ